MLSVSHVFGVGVIEVNSMVKGRICTIKTGDTYRIEFYSKDEVLMTVIPGLSVDNVALFFLFVKPALEITV